MHPDWVRGLRDQLYAAGAKLFVKQIGSNHALWPSVTGKGEDPARCLNLRALQKGEKDRGLAIGPAAGDRLGDFL